MNKFLILTALALLVVQGKNAKELKEENVEPLLEKLKHAADTYIDSLFENDKKEITADISSLVRSYLEKEEKDDHLDEFHDYLHREKRAGRYCCSPRCDKMMERLGNPSPVIIHCTNGKYSKMIA